MCGVHHICVLTRLFPPSNEVKKEIAELELLLAGTNQTSQSTQLLKKRKEMREVWPIRVISVCSVLFTVGVRCFRWIRR